MRVSVQTSHDEEILKMRKFLPSPVSAMDSSSTPPKTLRNASHHISKEALELWMKTHPDHSFRKTALSFGVSHSTIVRLCKKYGIGARHIRYPRDALEHYLLSHPDATYKEIAEHFGGGLGSANLAVYRHGLDHLLLPHRKWKKNRK